MNKPSLLALILVCSLSVQIAEARSGCCSHHGGVVGCGCGDGTPLSDTCAPYYPECNGGGYTEIAPTPKAPARPSCPTNADYVGGSCVCRDGYAMFGSSCVKVPANAHVVVSAASAWECDDGYRETGNSCVKIERTSSISPASSTPAVTPIVDEVNAQQPTPIATTTETEGNPVAGGFMLLLIGGGVYWFIRRRRMKKAKSNIR